MRDFVLTIGIDKFYLTQEERDFYLGAIEKGSRFVALPDGRVLGNNFQSLVHKNVLDGKWQCPSGNWHNRGADCFCTGEYKELPNGKVQYIESGEES